MRIPTVTLRHKAKGKRLIVNEADWAQDLGKYKWSSYERIGEAHNEAATPLEVRTVDVSVIGEKERRTIDVPIGEIDPIVTTPPRRRGRPRKDQ